MTQPSTPPNPPPAAAPGVHAALVARWRTDLARHQASLAQDSTSSAAWAIQFRIEALSFLLGRFGPSFPPDPNTPPPPPPDAAPRAPEPDPGPRWERPVMPSVPQGMGQAPRSADAFRSKLGRLADANRQRHGVASVERDRVKAALDSERRQRLILDPMRRLGLLIEARDFDRLCGTRRPPDFTLAELYDCLMSNQASAACRQCTYSLRGLPPQGRCPECGSEYQLFALALDALAQLLQKASPSGRSLTPKDPVLAGLGLWD